MRPARVFISCGQRETLEKETGLQVADYFRDRGFEAFFAERVHSPEALTEVIFKFLSESEYFVFIDFKREQITEGEYRGSLFAGQELAIATYLKLEGIGFLEEQVKREGIADFQLYNAIRFKDPSEILAALDRGTENWDPSSVNELVIRYDPNATTKNISIGDLPGNPLSDWYHLEVENRNKRRNAMSCLGYVSAICERENGREYDLPTVELNWAGIRDFVANIIAGGRRDLDAFFVVYGQEKVRFHERPLGTTNPRYHLPQLPAGHYDIEYTVISANFAVATKRYFLEFDGTPDSLRFQERIEAC